MSFLLYLPPSDFLGSQTTAKTDTWPLTPAMHLPLVSHLELIFQDRLSCFQNSFLVSRASRPDMSASLPFALEKDSNPARFHCILRFPSDMRPVFPPLGLCRVTLVQNFTFAACPQKVANRVWFKRPVTEAMYGINFVTGPQSACLVSLDLNGLCSDRARMLWLPYKPNLAWKNEGEAWRHCLLF